jgi:hypothetical protein
MAKQPPNHGKPWTEKEIKQLKVEVKQNTPTRVIALKHQRTETAIYGKASEESISLSPTNQSPYNRRK